MSVNKNDGAENTNTPGAEINSFAEKAKKIFDAHPSSKELYFTSDGLAFIQKCDAQNHARGLKDKEVKTTKR